MNKFLYREGSKNVTVVQSLQSVVADVMITTVFSKQSDANQFFFLIPAKQRLDLFGPKPGIDKCAKRLTAILNSVVVEELQDIKLPSRELQKSILQNTGVKTIFMKQKSVILVSVLDNNMAAAIDMLDAEQEDSDQDEVTPMIPVATQAKKAAVQNMA